MGLWLPPALLIVPVVVIGLAPFLAEPFVRLVTEAVIGGTAPMPDAYLKIWHGLVPALWMSVVAVIGGALLLAIYRPLARGWDAAPRPEAKVIFEGLIERIVAAAAIFSRRLHDGAFTRFAAIMILTVIAVGAHAWFSGTSAGPTRDMLPITPVGFASWLMLVTAAGFLVAVQRNRLAVLILMGIIGLMVSVGFNYFSAPIWH